MTSRKHLVVACAIIVVVASIMAAVSHASIMGIDLGTESIKISAPKKNNLDIVLNEQSHRKSWNAVGFRADERFFAEDAKNLAARFPDNMILGCNRLVGTMFNDTESRNWYRNKMRYTVNVEEFAGYKDVEEATENSNETAEDAAADSSSTDAADAGSPRQHRGTYGTLAVRTGSNPNISYSAEALTGMIFTYIKQTVEKDAKLKITDAVVTIAAHSNARQRQALIDAAELAGVRVVSLVHPTTAAALQFGMNRRGFGNESVSIIILDIGAGHADAGVYTFGPTPQPAAGSSKKKKKIPNSEALGTIETRAIVSTRDIGGRLFDGCLAEYIEDKFIEKFPKRERILGGETLAKRKSVISLMRAANKAKEMLSANRQAPITVEGMAPNTDFPITIKREEFEERCAPLFDSITDLVKEAIRRSGVEMSEMQAFELFGGGSRIPKIVETLTALREKPVDRTLNTDESAALGAGFYAGSLAGRFRIKSFAVAEYMGSMSDPLTEHNISFSLTPKPGSDSAPRYRTLYSAASRYGARKSVTVNRNEDFGMYIYHSSQTADGTTVTHEQSRVIDRYVNVTGIVKALESTHYYYADAGTSGSEAEDSNSGDAAQPQRTLRHPNNTHSIRVDFRLSESGLLELEQAEVRATFIQNISKKFKVNLTDEEIEEAREKAKARVVAAEEAKAAARANATKNETADDQDQREEDSAASSSSENNETTDANNNNTTDGAEGGDEANNETKTTVKKPKKKKQENATEILERKIRIAQAAVRTYKVDYTMVEEARRKTVPLSVSLSFVEPTPHLSHDKVLAKRILRKHDEVDRVKRETAAAKNDLEAFIVWCKNEGILENTRLREEFKLLDEAEEKKIVEALTTIGEWLEEDGSADDVPKSAFVEKLKELHIATGGVLSKYNELIAPPKPKKNKKPSSSSSSSSSGSSKDSDNETSADSNDDNNNNTSEDYTDVDKDESTSSTGDDDSDKKDSSDGQDKKESSDEDGAKDL